MFAYSFIHYVVTIVVPPENTTISRGSNVTISCGYVSATAFPVTWIINGTSFTQEEVVDSPLYQLNNPHSPSRVSLIVFSINHTTAFQCIVHSTPSTTSTLGTVKVTTGKCVASVCCYSCNIQGREALWKGKDKGGYGFSCIQIRAVQ